MQSVHLQQVKMQSQVAGKVIRDVCSNPPTGPSNRKLIVACGPLQARMLPLQGIRAAGRAAQMQHGPLRALLPPQLRGSMPADQLGCGQRQLPVPCALLCTLRPQW